MTENPIVYSFKIKNKLIPFGWASGNNDASQLQAAITKYWTGIRAPKDPSLQALVKDYITMALASRQLETEVFVYADGSWATETKDIGYFLPESEELKIRFKDEN